LSNAAKARYTVGFGLNAIKETTTHFFEVF